MPASEITAYSIEIGVPGGKSFAGRRFETVGLSFGLGDHVAEAVLSRTSQQALDPKPESPNGVNFR